MTSAAEPLLLAALDAEWAVQSERARPLVATPFVREALELAVAGSPQGILGVAEALDARDDTPEALVRRVNESLPEAPDPWTLRLLGRMRSLPLPPERPQLEPPEEPVVLELAPLPAVEATTVGIPVPAEAPRRSWRAAAGVASGAAGGLALAMLLWLAGAGG
jgi:hypothetical protein